MTGAFFRIKRGDEWENVEIENLTESELVMVLADKDQRYLISAISLLCKIIQRVEPLFQQLERDGIIQKASEPQSPESEEDADEQGKQAV